MIEHRYTAPLTQKEVARIFDYIVVATPEDAMDKHFAQECIEMSAELSKLGARLLKFVQIREGQDPTDADPQEVEKEIEYSIQRVKDEAIDVWNYLHATGYAPNFRRAMWKRDEKLIRWYYRLKEMEAANGC